MWTAFCIVLFVILALYGAIATVLVNTLLRRNDELTSFYEELETHVSAAVELLDMYHTNLEQASQTDVLLDEPFVRNVVNDIQSARNAVQFVYNKFTVLNTSIEDINSEE